MRFLLAMVAALIALAGSPALAQKGELGANYNEHYEDVDYRDLERARAKWVRIFLPMRQLDRQPAAEHGAVKQILDAKARGYKTILTLKYNYNGIPFPEAGGEEYQRQIARTASLLPMVMGKVDILMIGNEPFIESRRQDWNNNFNAFYEGIAARVIAYRNQHCSSACPTRLYMGALNQLWKDTWRTPVTDRWMAFVKETPELDGVSIHPHLSQIEQSQAFLDYILPRMRPNQTFIVTEFSLVWWWKEQMGKPVSPAFTSRYGLPKNVRNWQIVKAALEEPFPKEQWDDFLRMSPWFETRKHFLRNQMALFNKTGRLTVATYGFKQGSSMFADWGPDKTPWLINSVFATAVIRKNADGSAQPNYAWIDDFRALQEK